MATIDYKQKIKDYMNSSEVDTLYKSMLNNLFPELAESEDKRIRKAIIKIIGDIDGGFKFEKYGILKKDALAWLIKETKGNEREIPNYAWSGEDEDYRLNANVAFDDYFEKEYAGALRNWLNSIKERVQPQNIVYYNPYKEVVESIAEMCKHYDKASHSGLRDFYDDVKVKCKDAKEYESLYPQSTWKPSDEQMERLEGAINSLPHQEVLYSLYQDLKKLKG